MKIRDAKKLLKKFPVIVRTPQGFLDNNRAYIEEFAVEYRKLTKSNKRIFLLSDDDCHTLEIISIFHGDRYRQLLKNFSKDLTDRVGKY